MSMPAKQMAVLTDEQGRAVLRFRRRLAQPVDRVWSALTQTDQLQRWHPTPFALEPAVGGRVDFRSDLGGPDMRTGVVRAYDAPRTLAYTWGEDELRFELEPSADGGCELVLTHSFDDRMKAARDAAGWDLCLRALDRSLAAAGAEAARGARAGAGAGGDAGTPEREAQRIPDGWEQLNADYERHFGIPHELATPAPTQEELQDSRARRSAGARTGR
jgi:uncharacterized protein YndB with AHSA1/START domain